MKKLVRDGTVEYEAFGAEPLHTATTVYDYSFETINEVPTMICTPRPRTPEEVAEWENQPLTVEERIELLAEVVVAGRAAAGDPVDEVVVSQLLSGRVRVEKGGV